MLKSTGVRLSVFVLLYVVSFVVSAQAFEPVTTLGDNILDTFSTMELAIFGIAGLFVGFMVLFRGMGLGVGLVALLAGGILIGNWEDLAGFVNIGA